MKIYITPTVITIIAVVAIILLFVIGGLVIHFTNWDSRIVYVTEIVVLIVGFFIQRWIKW